jgi:hypothetical protein
MAMIYERKTSVAKNRLRDNGDGRGLLSPERAKRQNSPRDASRSNMILTSSVPILAPFGPFNAPTGRKAFLKSILQTRMCAPSKAFSEWCCNGAPSNLGEMAGLSSRSEPEFGIAHRRTGQVRVRSTPREKGGRFRPGTIGSHAQMRIAGPDALQRSRIYELSTWRSLKYGLCYMDQRVMRIPSSAGIHEPIDSSPERVFRRVACRLRQRRHFSAVRRRTSHPHPDRPNRRVPGGSPALRQLLRGCEHR